MTSAALRPVTVAESREMSLRDRRKKPRTAVPPMYSMVSVRVLNKRQKPLEGHALNVSESGLAIELDDPVPPGTPVTVEFSVSGLGRERAQSWPTFAATAEVVRNQDDEDFPQGPYQMGLRFVRITTMAQAQIARYIAAHAGPRHADNALTQE
jgi:c-di-GMP-binding flagellar brake protein YcgR